MTHTYLPVVIVVAIALVVIVINLVMRRNDYDIPGKTAVRCSKGHIFRTTWIEGGSIKAIKLGLYTRFQHCPVGKHWAIVHPVKDQDLTS